jgi:predicted kinase
MTFNIKSLEEVELEYIKSIAVPGVKPQKQFFLCPVGLVGAGKTTVTKPIAEAFDMVRVSTDELRKLLKEAGHGYEQISNIIFKIITGYIKDGYSIAFDMDCGNPDIKKILEPIAKDINAKIIWVHIDTPEEHIFDKFRKHPPTWLADNPQAMIDNYHRQKEKRIRENIAFDFFYTFDTSRADIKEQIKDCCSKIEAYLG